MQIATKNIPPSYDANTSPIVLNNEQQQILAFYQKQLNFLKPCRYYQFQFEDALSETYIVATSSIRLHEETYRVIFALPTSSTKAFVILSDDAPSELIKLAAFCCSQSESNDALKPGYSTNLTPSKWNSICQRNWYGFVLTNINQVISSTQGQLDIEGEHFEICLILLLNHNEYKKVKKTDTEALMTLFAAQERPLFQYDLYTQTTTQQIENIELTLPPNKIHCKNSFTAHKKYNPDFLSGSTLTEAVAFRQKPEHTHPAQINIIKNKLQQELNYSQKIQPLPIHLIEHDSQQKNIPSTNLLTHLQERKQQKKKHQMLVATTLSSLSICIIGLASLYMITSAPILTVIAALALGGCLGTLVSAFQQHNTLGL